MLDRLTSIPTNLFTLDGTRLNGRAYVFLILLCLAFFVPGIVTLPPTDRDESLFAQASKQMIESGNYVDIRFQNTPRYRKPVGIYWLQAASVKLLNSQHLDEIWAYRIPSLIGATVAVVMTACLGALLFGPMTGLLAAIMLASCMVLNIEARLAKTDAALLGCVAVAQYALARGYIGYRQMKIGWGIPFAFWTAIGVGILLKGPIILLVVLATLLWLRVSEKNLAWFASLKPYFGIPYVLLLVAPWFATIMLASHGQFLEQSAGFDLFGKIWHGQGRGFMPPGTYIFLFLLSFFPFALWGFLAVPDSWRNRREPGVRFCLGWIVPVWIVFELAFAKLPHYVMPVYPAIAILAAKAMLEGFPALADRSFRWLPPLAISLWLMVGMGFALAAVLLPYALNGAWNPPQIVAGLLLLAAQGASLFLFFRRRESGVIALAAGSLVFMTVFFGFTSPALQNLWVSSDILRAAESIKPCPGPPRIVSAYNEPSLVFLAGTATILDNDGLIIADDLRQDRCRIGVIKDKQRDVFLQSFANEADRPHQAAIIRGFVWSRGRTEDISLYLMPPEKKATP